MKDYWDIDDILSQEEVVKVKVNQEIRGLFEQDSSNRKTQVSLWFGLILATRDLAEIQSPKYLCESYCGCILAGPTLLNLKQHSAYFFEISSLMTEILDFPYMVPLVPAFLLRVFHIFESIDSLHSGAIVKKLTVTEQKIYLACRNAAKAYQEWRERKKEKLMIERSLKRLKTND